LGRSLRNFFDDGTEELLKEVKHMKENGTFDETMAQKAIYLYFSPDGSEVDFLDFEIYDQTDEIIIQQHLEDDRKNDLIKKSIRWKQKQIEKINQLPYFETEEERKKKVRYKEKVWKSIYSLDSFIYRMSQTTCNFEKSYIKWKESHDVYEDIRIEEYQDNELDWNSECTPSTEKDPSSPQGFNLTEDEELREGMVKKLIYSQVQATLSDLSIFYLSSLHKKLFYV
jgi:hypothetical protein